MCQHKNDLEWLRANERYLRLGRIAADIKITRRTFEGTVRGQADSHGTPFKIPDKYHSSLTLLIKQIRKK